MTGDLLGATRRFGGQRVLVVGDLMLDEYLRGHVRRISPEAPVPVVEVVERIAMPGGAGNVAENLRALGADVRLAGFVGDDAAGAELRRTFEESGIDCRAVLTCPGRPTTVKTRVVAQNQQVVRVDREVTDDVVGPPATCLYEALMASLNEVDAVLFQDYDKGALAQAPIGPIIAAATERGALVTVDPKRRRFFSYHGATLFKPNLREASEALGRPLTGHADEDAAGHELLERLGCRYVLLTLGERGMALYERGAPPHRVPATAHKEIYDVSGAGDTVISAVTIALAAGVDARLAAHIASVAAAVKLGKLGAVPVSKSELLAALETGRV